MEGLEPATIQLPPGLAAQLQTAADAAGCPVDDVIRYVLQRAVGRHEPLVASSLDFDKTLCPPELARAIDELYPGWSRGPTS